MYARRRWQVGVSGLCLALLLAWMPAVARAHDVTGTRFDAPIPISLLFAGGAATVAITAVGVALVGRPSTGDVSRSILTVDPRTASVLRTTGSALFGAGVVAVLVAGVFGRSVAADNFATVFTWPVWFRGLALTAVLTGSVWPALSPWHSIYRALSRLEGRTLAVFDTYPTWLGSWPSLAGFVVLFGVVETLTVVPRSPVLTALVVAIVTLSMVIGGILFGPDWFRYADPLGALYRVLGRVAPLSIDRTPEDGVTVSVRPPWQACRLPVDDTATALFVVAAVYTVSFDGFANTRLYQTVLFGVRDTLGTGPPTSILVYSGGLVVFVATFGMAVALSDYLGRPTDGQARTRRLIADGTAAFAPTVIPIAAAYEVAHNYPYVLRSTARVAEICAASLSVPIGSIDPVGWLTVPLFWSSEVVLIVLGHLIAVVATHGVATDRYPTDRAAVRGHLPLVAIMIAYTVLSLWIVSQPLVGG